MPAYDPNRERHLRDVQGRRVKEEAESQRVWEEADRRAKDSQEQVERKTREEEEEHCRVKEEVDRISKDEAEDRAGVATAEGMGRSPSFSGSTSLEEVERHSNLFYLPDCDPEVEVG